MNNKIDINRSNYEKFVIDYLDGILSVDENNCFIAFLNNNPDIAEEIEDLGEAVLLPEDVDFSPKEQLKKKPVSAIGNINGDNYEEYFIASYENDLISEEISNLNSFLAENIHLSPEYKIYGELKIIPDENVSFSGKSILKQRQIITPIWYSSAAAVVLLLISLWYFNNPKPEILQRQTISINKLPSKSTLNLEELNGYKNFHIDSRSSITIIPKSNLTNEEVAEKIYASTLVMRMTQTKLVDEADYRRIIEKQYDGAEVVYADAMNEVQQEKKSRSLLASIFNNQLNKVKSSISANNQKKSSSDEPTYVQVIDTGIKVFNTITGSETPTTKSYNANGELTGYKVRGREVLLAKNTHSKSVE